MNKTDLLALGFDDIVYAEGTCCVCGGQFVIDWTDRHGEAICIRCGAPYVILQYDANDQRIPGTLPRFAARADLLPALQAYWRETGRPLGMGTYLVGNRSKRVRADWHAMLDWIEQSEYAPLLEEPAHDRA